jgi:catechol 2,3-dioxygenase-like lactoylglutathione lyase family enzyme
LVPFFNDELDPLKDFLMDIEHVALNVPDPVAAAAWYVRHLGLQVIRSLSEAPFTHFLADSSQRVLVEMYANTKALVPDYQAMDPMIFHIAFVSADVRAERERLLAAGASSAGDLTITPAGDEMTFLRDPWGVPLQLVKRAVPLMG